MRRFLPGGFCPGFCLEMAEIGLVALAIDVVQVVKDAAHEASERVRAAQNLGALAGKRYEFEHQHATKREVCVIIVDGVECSFRACTAARCRSPRFF